MTQAIPALVALALLLAMVNSYTLLSPFQLGSLQLANRVVLAPMTRARAGVSRLANEYMREYYAQRAGAGLLITEATAISPIGYGWYASPGLYTEEQALAWKPIVDAVHAKGSKIFVQAWHMGRQSHSSFHNGALPVAPSALKISFGHTRGSTNEKVEYETPHALSIQEVKDTVQNFKQGAQLAKLAGFDGVEIHGANGYLIDAFLQSHSNHRTDEYGGSIPNRFRFLKEVVEATAEVYPTDRIGVRISPNDIFGDMGSADNVETFCYIAENLKPYGLAYLHVMDGLGFGFHNKCAAVTLFDMKKHFHGPVISNIAHTKETAEGALRSGACDLVAFGRPFISNPDLVERFTNNWPLAPDAPREAWYGDKPDAKDCLAGYTDFPVYQETKSM